MSVRQDLLQGRYTEAVNEHGAEAVRDEIDSMIYGDLAGNALRAANALGYNDLARSAAQVVTNSGCYDSDKALAARVLGLRTQVPDQSGKPKLADQFRKKGGVESREDKIQRLMRNISDSFVDRLWEKGARPYLQELAKKTGPIGTRKLDIWLEAFFDKMGKLLDGEDWCCSNPIEVQMYLAERLRPRLESEGFIVKITQGHCPTDKIGGTPYPEVQFELSY